MRYSIWIIRLGHSMSLPPKFTIGNEGGKIKIVFTLGLVDASEEALDEGVVLSGATGELQTSRGL